jgi:hypothetical protein
MRRSLTSIRSWPLILLLLCVSTTSQAIDLLTPIRKATEWVEKRSGLRPTGDNINRAAKAAAEAAKSTKQASDEARELLESIKWPLLVSLYLLALWLAGLGLKTWRDILLSARIEPERDTLSPAPLGSRVLLISFGSLAYFALISLLFVGSDTFGNPTMVLSYVLLSLGASLAYGLVLFWLPFKRTWSSLALSRSAKLF